MATKAELEREISNLENLISEAERASRNFRDQARSAGSDSERQRLSREAEQKDKFVNDLYNRVSGLRSHLRGL